MESKTKMIHIKGDYVVVKIHPIMMMAMWMMIKIWIGDLWPSRDENPLVIVAPRQGGDWALEISTMIVIMVMTRLKIMMMVIVMVMITMIVIIIMMMLIMMMMVKGQGSGPGKQIF